MTQAIENVAMKPTTLRKVRYGGMGPKIRSMVIGPYLNRVHKDYPYYNSRWFSVPGSVKRMNAFTGCFLYVAVQKTVTDAASAVSSDQFNPHWSSDSTIDEPALSFHYLVEYNEYNDSFDQHA